MPEVREPQQARSIDKKKRILQSGLEVFCEKGYYNTNTTEIAKRAGVSTGIIYGYFMNKKDILLQVLDMYFEHLYEPVKNYIESFNKDHINDEDIKKFIDIIVKTHIDNKVAHEEMVAMSHLDEDVLNSFLKNEENITQSFIEFLKKYYSGEHLAEKTHIAYNILEDLCHELVYHKHKDMDYNYMTNMVVLVLLGIFK